MSSDNFDQNHVNNSDWKDADKILEVQQKMSQEEISSIFDVYLYNKYVQTKPMSQMHHQVTISTKAYTNDPAANSDSD